MNQVVVECLISSSLLICLLRMKLFNKRWINMCVFFAFAVLIIAMIAVVFNRFFHFPYSPFICTPILLFTVIGYYVYSPSTGSGKAKKAEDVFELICEHGKILFYYVRDNFLVYGGAGSGKTASIGKPLLEQYIKHHWAGFIYDYKDFDYTKTAYNLIQKYDYPYKLYQISFTDMSRTHRFNPLKKTVIPDEEMLYQVIDDFLKAVAPKEAVKNDSGGWLNGATGLLRGVAVRFYRFKGEYEKFCTLPHILQFMLLATPEELTTFLEGDVVAKMQAGAFLGARSSDRTRDSYVSTLNNYISNIASNKKICYVLTGDDFDFYLNDPEEPKLFAVSNNFANESLISPIIAMLVPISARRIEFGNKVKFAYILDEMTTFRVNNFQAMPSVQREYGVSFLIMTQSSSKIESTYDAHDRASIESNCANLFIGRTKDIKALENSPKYFGKEEKEKKSYSNGSSSGNQNSNITVSTQKEEIYDANVFAELKQGEFILSAGQSNVKHLRTRFKKFELEEKPLPIIHLTSEKEVIDNFEQVGRDVERILMEMCGKGC